MTVAQGINKLVVFKKQSGLGVAAAGGGGQVLRRRTSQASAKRATYVNDEIVQHQQSTGVNLGTATTDWNFDGLLSPGTYSQMLGGLLRKDFATGVTASPDLTIAGAGPYTVTRAAGSYLTDGFKIGDVVSITAGTWTNAVNENNNLLVTNVTATVLTVVTLNGTTLIAEGPVTAATIAVKGKKSIVPASGHTDELFTIEEWFADLGKSELYPDMRIGQADISLPASGNAAIKLTGMGLGVRTKGNSQVLTTPTAATTTPVLTAVRGLLLVGGSVVTNVTGMNMSVKTTLTPEGPIVGSNFAPDMSRGRIEVTGQFTALFDNETLTTDFDSETLVSLVMAMAADTTNNSDVVTFIMSAVKLTSADADDGEKAIVKTYQFTAQLNSAGGAALANDQTIISIQDSQAS